MSDADGVAAVCRRNAPGEGLRSWGSPGTGALRPPQPDRLSPIASAHHLVAEDLQDGVGEIAGLGVAPRRRPR